MNMFSSIRLNQVRAAPATMMIRIWLFTALAMGLTIVVAWLALLSGVVNVENHPGIFMCNLILIFLISFWLDLRWDKFSTLLASLIGLVLIVLVGTALSAFFSILAIATVFGILVAIFVLSATLSLLLGWNPGSRWLILLMAVSGVLLAVIINSLMESTFSVWAMSILAALAWPSAVLFKLDVLSELSRKLYAGEFSTLPRCMVLGGVIIYLSVLSQFCQLLMFLLEVLFRTGMGMLGW
ncbi:Bax inhibitor 1 family protein [Pseudocitrobacter cyperus]|uniref:Uncharacterized protein n=1 Tax=Pseudocitrobacter cyperus TaxID=3112843 RepID=A0ABV0HG26_9ENTR